MLNKLKVFATNVVDVFDEVVLRIGTYEDMVTSFISNRPRITLWIWAGSLYLVWRFS